MVNTTVNGVTGKGEIASRPFLFDIARISFSVESMKSNPMVGASVIAPTGGRVKTTEMKERETDPRQEFQTETAKEESKREKTRSSLDFHTLPEKLAHSKMYHMNFRVPELEDAFPADTLSWSTDLCFPLAEGGPLYVDEPKHPYNVELCQRKAVVMGKAQKRYVYLVKGDTLETALMQLEGQLKARK